MKNLLARTFVTLSTLIILATSCKTSKPTSVYFPGITREIDGILEDSSILHTSTDSRLFFKLKEGDSFNNYTYRGDSNTIQTLSKHYFKKGASVSMKYRANNETPNLIEQEMLMAGRFHPPH